MKGVNIIAWLVAFVCINSCTKDNSGGGGEGD